MSYILVLVGKKTDIFDKLILVFYIDVSNVIPHEVHRFITKVREETTPTNQSDSNKMLRYFVPINGPSRIECLNPPCLCGSNKKNSKSIEKKLCDVNDRLDRLVESMYPIKRRVLIEKKQV